MKDSGNSKEKRKLIITHFSQVSGESDREGGRERERKRRRFPEDYLQSSLLCSTNSSISSIICFDLWKSQNVILPPPPTHFKENPEQQNSYLCQ